jgi:putative addiction module killer protein
MDYNKFMLQILRTAEFDAWISGLRDRIGQRQVLARLARLSLGHWGDCKPVGGEVTELRIDAGPGYRVYCWKDGATIVVALGGGDKSSQARDISRAQEMVQLLKE